MVAMTKKTKRMRMTGRTGNSAISGPSLYIYVHVYSQMNPCANDSITW